MSNHNSVGNDSNSQIFMALSNPQCRSISSQRTDGLSAIRQNIIWLWLTKKKTNFILLFHFRYPNSTNSIASVSYISLFHADTKCIIRFNCLSVYVMCKSMKCRLIVCCNYWILIVKIFCMIISKSTSTMIFVFSIQI